MKVVNQDSKTEGVQTLRAADWVRWSISAMAHALPGAEALVDLPALEAALLEVSVERAPPELQLDGPRLELLGEFCTRYQAILDGVFKDLVGNEEFIASAMKLGYLFERVRRAPEDVGQLHEARLDALRELIDFMEELVERHVGNLQNAMVKREQYAVRRLKLVVEEPNEVVAPCAEPWLDVIATEEAEKLNAQLEAELSPPALQGLRLLVVDASDAPATAQAVRVGVSGSTISRAVERFRQLMTEALRGIPCAAVRPLQVAIHRIFAAKVA